MKDIEIAEKIAEAVKLKGGCTYFTGGLVRDRLLGLEKNEDIDIEVHGIETEELRALLEEFGQVMTIGRAFGVYSLAGRNIDIAVPRREENTGRGHRDFEVYTDPYLGTEKAAKRRDFTINALMEDIVTGEIIDHFGGLSDLKKGILRHIDSESFVEDPLRVLRGARFAAVFDFRIAEETVSLCGDMDLSALPRERVAEELEKCLCSSCRPSVFFNALCEMNQMDVWFPEVEALKGIEQDPAHHPEGDVWQHTMMVLDKAAACRDKTVNPRGFMLAALSHDMGKIVTTEVINGKIHSYRHETEGIPIVKGFLDRLTGNRELKKYVLNMTALHMKPNVMAGCRSRVAKTNRLYDDSICPQDLIWFSEIDRTDDTFGKGAGDNLEFLLERLKIYEETMEEPYVSGQDLIEAGLRPDESFKEILEYAHKLRLAGVSKENALKQVMAYAGKVYGTGMR